VKATLQALMQCSDPLAASRRRGMSLGELFGKPMHQNTDAANY
jgi:hypothetical protein